MRIGKAEVDCILNIQQENVYEKNFVFDFSNDAVSGYGGRR